MIGHLANKMWVCKYSSCVCVCVFGLITFISYIASLIHLVSTIPFPTRNMCNLFHLNLKSQWRGRKHGLPRARPPQASLQRSPAGLSEESGSLSAPRGAWLWELTSTDATQYGFVIVYSLSEFAELLSWVRELKQIWLPTPYPCTRGF